MSTVLELCGFGLVTYAAYGWHHLVGFLVGGIFLVFIGYAFDDRAVAVAIRARITQFRTKERTHRLRPRA